MNGGHVVVYSQTAQTVLSSDSRGTARNPSRCRLTLATRGLTDLETRKRIKAEGGWKEGSLGWGGMGKIDSNLSLRAASLNHALVPE